MVRPDLSVAAAKIVNDRATLKARLTGVARPIVFTNGCFDLLHRGHVTYLEQARALGAGLIVGVNTDASVQRQDKETGRPINPLEDRLALLAALESVSLVVPFDEETPLELIKLVRPEHLVKGGDWPIDRIVGHEFVQSYGGKVHSIPFQFDRSTTDLVRRIRNS